MELPKELTTVTTTSKIIAMLVFIALPFLGFFAGTTYQASITSKSTENNIVPTPKTSTSSAIVNWKTYTSTAFSFRYDPSLYLDELTLKDTVVTLYNKNPRLSNQNVYYLGFNLIQDVTFANHINSYKQIEENQNISYTSKKLNEYTIYDVKGLPAAVNEKRYFIEGNNKLVSVGIGITPNIAEPEYLEFLNNSNQILSTFKFTK